MRKFHILDVAAASEVGVNGALVLNVFFEWTDKNRDDERHFYDGKYWFKITRSGLYKAFPYLSKAAIASLLSRLINEGYIVSGDYNSDKRDRTLWYALTTRSYKLLGVEKKTENAKSTTEVSFGSKTEVLEELPPFEGQLLDAVMEWLDYHSKDLKKPYRERGKKVLFAEIKKNAEMYGDEAVIQVIRSSIANGYQGLFFKNAARTQKGKSFYEIGEMLREDDFG